MSRISRELTARAPGVVRVVNQMELFEEDK
jgi:hypothetical protein